MALRPGRLKWSIEPSRSKFQDSKPKASYFGCFKVLSKGRKISLGTAHGIEAVSVLTLIVPKQRALKPGLAVYAPSSPRRGLRVRAFLFCTAQRAQYGLIKEYALNHVMDSNLI